MKSKSTVSQLSRQTIVDNEISSEREINTVVNANKPSSKSAIDRITAIHRPYGIYEECGHDHEPNEPGVIEVNDIGLVCAEGKMYDICVSCCMGGLSSTGQTETCASTHEHRLGEPICVTMREVAKINDAEDAATHKINTDNFQPNDKVFVVESGWLVECYTVRYVNKQQEPYLITCEGFRCFNLEDVFKTQQEAIAECMRQIRKGWTDIPGGGERRIGTPAQIKEARERVAYMLESARETLAALEP